MIQWIAVIVLVIFGLYLIKFEHFEKRVKLVILAILALLIYFSIISVLSSEVIDLKTSRGVIKAGYLYFGWLGNTASALWDIGTSTVRTVGNAINLNITESENNRR